MKTITTIAFGLLLFASCKKEEGYAPEVCGTCETIITDSATGTILPNPNTPQKYCDGALNQVKNQPPVYFHNTVYMGGYDTTTYYTTVNGENIDTLIISSRVSTTQKYEKYCY